jgi:hypothetical protein
MGMGDSILEADKKKGFFEESIERLVEREEKLISSQVTFQTLPERYRRVFLERYREYLIYLANMAMEERRPFPRDRREEILVSESCSQGCLDGIRVERTKSELEEGAVLGIAIPFADIESFRFGQRGISSSWIENSSR